VLNYRTDEMPIREMTYLFTLIALPVINSFLTDQGMTEQVVLANVLTVAVLYALEKGWGFHYEASKKVTYDTIHLITPANRDLLIDDLRTRTGLPIKRVEVGKINFLRDTAQVRVYYDDPNSGETGWREQPNSTDRVLARLSEEEDI
jgi:hypothetical protein